MRPSTSLSMALMRAQRTAAGLMSTAVTEQPLRAAVMAATPEPVPRSRTRLDERTRSERVEELGEELARAQQLGVEHLRQDHQRHVEAVEVFEHQPAVAMALEESKAPGERGAPQLAFEDHHRRSKTVR